MLVCPKCQYKNPINHKFCQKCGTSLTQKVCPECNTQISLSALNCHHCGAKTGKTLWGIILPKVNLINPSAVVPYEYESTEVESEINNTDDILSPSKAEEDTQGFQVMTEIGQPDEEVRPIGAELSTNTENIEGKEGTMIGAVGVEAAETVVETLVEDVLTPHTPETKETPALETPAIETPATSEPDFSIAPGDYLDDRQRYQLISQIGEKTPSGEWQGSVLDCQPLQISPLLTSISAASSSSRSGSTIQPSLVGLIPAIAQPYLQLRSQWAPIIPLIHDAWENQDYSILLIEDRSNLPRLIDQCHQLTQVEPLDLQPFIQWFKQMTQLWQVLTPLKCRQSLLNIDNLLVDLHSGGLRLQRLYGDATTAPKLAELGKIWQKLLPIPIDGNDSASNDPEIIQRINDVVNDVVNEKILTPDKLLATIQTRLLRNATANAHPRHDNDEISHGDDLSTIAMTQGLKNLEAIGATDVGQQRNHNEDDFAIQTEIFKSQTSRDRSLQFRGIYIVCDGMGGHDGGEVASTQAVKTLQEYFATHWQDPLTLPDEATIRQGILEANQAIYDLNQEEVRSGSGRMGTTLVMALVNQNEIAVAHVGDSRLYRLTKTHGLQQLTVDHEVGQREIQRGIDPEIAYSRPDAYQLTQALGPRPENFVQPDIQFFPIEENSLFILASDGLTDNDLLENHISTHLEPLLNSDTDLNQGVKDLIALANDYNGHDNITAIAIRAIVQPESNQPESN